MVYHRPVGAGPTQPSMGIKPGRRTTPVPNSGVRITAVPNTERPTAGFGAGAIVPDEAGVSAEATTGIRRGKLITRVIPQLVKERSIIRRRVRGPGVSLISISLSLTPMTIKFVTRGQGLFIRADLLRIMEGQNIDFIMTVGQKRSSKGNTTVGINTVR